MSETEYQQGYRLGYQHGLTKARVEMIDYVNTMFNYTLNLQKTERAEGYLSALQRIKNRLEEKVWEEKV